MSTIGERGYHHGDLRRTILAAAVDAIAEQGPTAWSLRELARRAGVSHAAPAHHFGDKTGLLTVIAAEGFGLLADALGAGDDLLEAGVAYVRFAVTHPAHFAVMFEYGLYRGDDPDVRAAQDRAAAALSGGVRAYGEDEEHAPNTELAAWSIAHGFAKLWASGALPEAAQKDPVTAARPVLRRLLTHED